MAKDSTRGVLQLVAVGALGIYALALTVSGWILRLMWAELTPGDSEFVRRMDYKPRRASETAEEYRRAFPRGRFYIAWRVCYWVSWTALGIAVLCVPLYFVVD